MISLYNPCPCKSGKKFKFCCYTILKEKSSSELVKVAPQWPVYRCWSHHEESKPHKLTVFIVRTIPNGNFILGCYLLDLLCLGIKDTFLAINLSQSGLAKYELVDERITEELISYQDARSLILGSLAFAKKHGFAAHDDWEESKCMVEPNDSYEEKFTFGVDGKAHYIPSIHDKGFEHTPEGKKVIISYT